MRNRFNRYILYAVIFLVTAVLTFLSMALDDEAANAMSMNEASLPVVMVQTDEGTMYNQMHGYTGKVREELLSMYLTPLDSDRVLDIVVNTYGESVNKIAYKVRDLETLSLIENTDVTDWEADSNQLVAQFKIKNLIDDDKPYILEITLETAECEEIKYYTKIITGTDYKLQDKLNFVLSFNAATFDPERVNEFAKKLSTKSSADESNYGSVTINNSKTLVGWGTLAPFVESNIVPCVYDLYDDVAIIGLDYTMGAANSHGSYDTYAVHEYYRVRQTTKNMYLLNYDRETNQIFEVDNAMPSTDKINLGIGSDMEVQLITSGKKNFTYFENVGSIWCFDSAENLFTKVFSFATEDSDNVRERYANHSIKLINVDDEGNCNFLVYGYMNRGTHEGELGISLYSYNYKEDYVVEKLFIPSDKPYELLSGSVGGVAYVNNSNAFYILINNSLYSIDLISKEIMTVANNLTKDNYKVSDDGRIVAYVTGEDIYSSSEVRVFNMETGTDHYVKGGEGEKVRPLGFIENDFIYGFANEQNIFEENDGTQVFAMHTVEIINEEYSVIKQYSQENIYLSDVEIANLRINLYRMNKNEDGSFSNISMDQLINHNENVEKQETTVSSMSTEAKKKMVVLKLAKSAQANESIVVRSAGQIEYLEENVLNWADDIEGADKYYVQSSGQFRGSCNTVEEAAALTGSEMGIIKDDDNNVVWKKYKSSSAAIKGFSLSGGSSYENVRAVIESFAGSVSKNWIRMEGIAPENVLPFVSEGSPVMGKTANGYVVIVAYDSKTITYADGDTGTQIAVSISDANKLFAQGGNVFITYYSLDRQ